jgi:hypothetical protein
MLLASLVMSFTWLRHDRAIVRGLQDRWRLLEFSPTSPTEGGHTQHIRERFLPPFSPGFWDGVGFLLIVGLCAHKRPKRRLSDGLGQVDANSYLSSRNRITTIQDHDKIDFCQSLGTSPSYLSGSIFKVK